MTTAADTSALTGAIIACWIIFVVRLIGALRKQLPGHDIPSSVHAIKWSIWVIAFCIVLAGTTNHPAIINYLDHIIGEWFGTIPRTVFALIPYIVGDRICLSFLPTYRLFRWNWPFCAGLLTLGAYVLVLRLAAANPSLYPHPVTFYRSTLADSLLHSFILVSTVRIILPALSWLRRKEEYATMRLRLAFLIAMYALIVIWMTNDIVLELARTLGVPYYLHQLVHPVGDGGVAFLFILSFFGPPGLFRWLAQPFNYLVSLLTFISLRSVERRACAWTGQHITDAPVIQVIGSPNRAIYMSTITILDARKILKAHESPAARELAARLDIAAQPQLELSDVVMRLRRVGNDCLLGRLASATTI